MKGKEIMVVSIIIIILLIIIIVGVNKGKEKEEINNIGTENINENQGTEEKEELGEFETETVDGTKVNISEELSETKELEGLEISNIKLIEKENLSVLTADVKNPTNETLGEYDVNITIIDKEGNEIITIAGYIDKVEAGKTVELNTSVTADVADAYDFKISK